MTPRTGALFDGSVQPDGVQLRCESQFGDGLDNTGARHRAIIGGAIDGGECSTSSLILARNRCQMQQGLLSCQPVLEESVFSRNLERLKRLRDAFELEPSPQ